MHWLAALWHWIEVHTGTVNESGPYYGFWSGFGSDIGEVTIIGGVFMWWRKHNCHVGKCARLGKHSVDGTGYVTCAKHHPDPAVLAKPTAEHIATAHARARR